MKKQPKKTSINNKDLKKIANLMLDKKAINVTLIDVSRLTTLTDYFLICTSDSDPQTRAIYNHIKDSLIEQGIKPWKTEGYEYLNWVVMDYINFVIHIFDKKQGHIMILKNYGAMQKLQSLMINERINNNSY